MSTKSANQQSNYRACGHLTTEGDSLTGLVYFDGLICRVRIQINEAKRTSNQPDFLAYVHHRRAGALWSGRNADGSERMSGNICLDASHNLGIVAHQQSPDSYRVYCRESDAVQIENEIHSNLVPEEMF